MSFEVLDYRRRVRDLYAQVRTQSDPAAGYYVWRAGREDLFKHHSASARQPGQHLVHADYDPAWRFTVPVEDTAPESFDVSTGTDGTAPFERLGRVRLPGLGSLDVWWLRSYGGGVFLPIKDGSSGLTTYGGGRYVLDTTKGADLGGDRAALVVDLNFAYNPSCAYDPAWACPLAPAGNTIEVPVDVGELSPEFGLNP